MIDDARKLIFVENPKTATYSIKRAFWGDDFSEHPDVRIATVNHDTPKIIKSKHPEEWRDYTTFVVVRNTWDRARSFYEFYRNVADARSYQEMSFDEWINKGCPRPKEDHLAAPMWGEGRADDVLCQLRYCEGVHEIVVLHSFDREQRSLELKKGIDRVCKRIGINPLKISADSSHHSSADQPIVWKRSTVERLAEAYKEEIERFGFLEPEAQE